MIARRLSSGRGPELRHPPRQHAGGGIFEDGPETPGAQNTPGLGVSAPDGGGDAESPHPRPSWWVASQKAVTASPACCADGTVRAPIRRSLRRRPRAQALQGVLGSGADLRAGAPIERLGRSVLRRTRRSRTRWAGIIPVLRGRSPERSGYFARFGAVRRHRLSLSRPGRTSAEPSARLRLSMATPVFALASIVDG
jgi:hypothetical protein